MPTTNAAIPIICIQLPRRSGLGSLSLRSSLFGEPDIPARTRWQRQVSIAVDPNNDPVGHLQQSQPVQPRAAVEHIRQLVRRADREDGVRDKVYIASKFCTGGGHLPQDTPVPDIMRAVESSLTRLQTDYLDVCLIHEVNSVERLMAPTFHEAFDRLKEQGKVRFLGVSSHTPNLEEVMRHAVDSGRFSMLLVAYNFGNWPDLTNIFRDAKQR